MIKYFQICFGVLFVLLLSSCEESAVEFNDDNPVSVLASQNKLPIVYQVFSRQTDGAVDTANSELYWYYPDLDKTEWYFNSAIAYSDYVDSANYVKLKKQFLYFYNVKYNYVGIELAMPNGEFRIEMGHKEKVLKQLEDRAYLTLTGRRGDGDLIDGASSAALARFVGANYDKAAYLKKGESIDSIFLYNSKTKSSKYLAPIKTNQKNASFFPYFSGSAISDNIVYCGENSKDVYVFNTDAMTVASYGSQSLKSAPTFCAVDDRIAFVQEIDGKRNIALIDKNRNFITDLNYSEINEGEILSMKWRNADIIEVYQLNADGATIRLFAIDLKKYIVKILSTDTKIL
jgi:hypothetical protein